VFFSRSGRWSSSVAGDGGGKASGGGQTRPLKFGHNGRLGSIFRNVPDRGAGPEGLGNDSDIAMARVLVAMANKSSAALTGPCKFFGAIRSASLESRANPSTLGWPHSPARSNRSRDRILGWCGSPY